MYKQKDWERLGEALVERRVELGEPKRAPFSKRSGFTNDRVLFDLEKGRRTNYDQSTLIQVERAYQWPQGSITRILRGQQPLESSSSAAPPAGTIERGEVSQMRTSVFGALSHLESATASIHSSEGEEALLSIGYAQHEIVSLIPKLFSLEAQLDFTVQEDEEVDVEAHLDNLAENPHEKDFEDFVARHGDFYKDYDLAADDGGGHSHEDEDEQTNEST